MNARVHEVFRLLIPRIFAAADTPGAILAQDFYLHGAADVCQALGLIDSDETIQIKGEIAKAKSIRTSLIGTTIRA